MSHDRPGRLHADHRPLEGRDKSGGEWISSIDLENIAVSHPAIAEAAVIGVRHPNGTNGRPDRGEEAAGASLARTARFYAGKVAKWWVPDDVRLRRAAARTRRPGSC